MRSERSAAVRAKDGMQQSSSSEPSGSEDESEFGSGSESSLENSSSPPTPKTALNSLDKFTFAGASSERPWISTIRGPATRLEGLNISRSSHRPSRLDRSSNRRSSRDSSSENASGDSSKEEESFSSGGSSSSYEESEESDGGKRERGNIQKSKKYVAPVGSRQSERIREAAGSRAEDPGSASSEGRYSKKQRRDSSDESDESDGAESDVAESESESSSLFPEDHADYSNIESTGVDESPAPLAGLFIVEKIIAKRRSLPSAGWEYLVKWKDRSYMHCEWLSGSVLSVDAEGDKRSVKLKNFNAKQGQVESVALFPNGLFFNPIFLQIDRILALRYGSNSTVEYLVKWEGVGYAESTWETADALAESAQNKMGRFASAVEYFEKVNGAERRRSRLDVNTKEFRRKRGFDPVGEFGSCLTELKDDRNSKGPAEFAYGPYGEKNLRLFDFQKEGISWLLYNWSQARGCMLADEMGLGKTVQTAVALAEMQRHAQLHEFGDMVFLIVAPLSTIEQWKREILKWTSLVPVVYHGNKLDREVIKQYEFDYVDVERTRLVQKPSPLVLHRRSQATLPKFDVLITTFETVAMEQQLGDEDRSGGVSILAAERSDFVWSCIIVDEAHKLKASEGRARTSVISIPTRHRILLTGTPIQNNVTELWNLLHICAPNVWNDKKSFLAKFGDLKSVQMTARLQSRIAPFLLQRKKADVLAHLVPAKEETIVSVELTRLQKETYRAVYEKNLEILVGAEFKKLEGKKQTGVSAPTLNNVHMELRKTCNHPFLVEGVENRVLQNVRNYDTQMNLLINSSGKMVFLDKLLEKLAREKSKILIFSQFTMMLDIIEDYLRWKQYTFERLDGGVNRQLRQEAIDRFNSSVEEQSTSIDPSFVFLLSTKAGGVGLNLTAANYVLLFDHDWNPQNDLQAQARCHRIGQTKEVQIFRLVTRGTYEEKMFKVASKKLGLERAVMASNSVSTPEDGDCDKGTSSAKLTKEELDVLLREGAYAMFTDDENEKKFCAEDIEEILKNRSQTVSTFVDKPLGDGDAATNGAKNSAKSSFSTARFKVNEKGDDIDLEDPLFWSKMAELSKKTNVDPDAAFIVDD